MSFEDLEYPKSFPGENNYLPGLDGKRHITNFGKWREPSPPEEFYNVSMHHYLTNTDSNNKSCDNFIAAWDHIKKRWYFSGYSRQNSKPLIRLLGAFYIGPVTFPDLPEFIYPPPKT